MGVTSARKVTLMSRGETMHTRLRRPPHEGTAGAESQAETYAVSESTHSWFAATQSVTICS